MGLNLQFHSLQRDASDIPGALGTDGIHKEFEACEVLLVNLLMPVTEAARASERRRMKSSYIKSGLRQRKGEVTAQHHTRGFGNTMTSAEELASS